MIFGPELAKLVLRGVKTETRRKVKPSQHDCRYRLQHTYAIQRTPTGQDRRDGFQGRAKTIEGARLIVTDVRHELLADLNQDAAKAEGFKTPAEFANYWMRLYEKNWPPQEEQLCPACNGHAEINGQPCPVPKCELGTTVEDKRFEPDEIWDRFLHRHGDTAVWVIQFELEQDQLRLLTPSTRPHGSELGYTTEPWDAMSDEPEAIDPARIHVDWRTRDKALHRASLQSVDGSRLAGLRTDEERLQELRRLAAERKVDVRNDVNVIRSRMDAMERKIRAKTDGRAA